MQHIKKPAKVEPGDIVNFKKRPYVVLNSVQTGDKAFVTHIYSPQYGVYSALYDEIEIVGHSELFPELCEEISKANLKTA